MSRATTSMMGHKSGTMARMIHPVVWQAAPKGRRDQDEANHEGNSNNRITRYSRLLPPT